MNLHQVMVYSIPHLVDSGSQESFLLELLDSVLLAVCSFWLGACPFSVWIGRWLLDKDIRDYGDGNPGAVNVFRAGGRRAGSLALLLDIAKGVPFVLSAHALLALPDVAVMVIGMSAILGHAFSPLLRFHGGKALAVTLGVLLALPQHRLELLFSSSRSCHLSLFGATPGRLLLEWPGHWPISKLPEETPGNRYLCFSY